MKVTMMISITMVIIHDGNDYDDDDNGDNNYEDENDDETNLIKEIRDEINLESKYKDNLYELKEKKEQYKDPVTLNDPSKKV